MCGWLGFPVRPIYLWYRQLLCSFFLTKKVVTWFFEREAFYHSTNNCQGLFSGFRILRRGETAVLLVWRCFTSLTLLYLGTKFIKIMIFIIYIIIWIYLITYYFTVKSFLYVGYETIQLVSSLNISKWNLILSSQDYLHKVNLAFSW